ncbi:MAG: ATP-binding protein [Deltaproteobacteria bacterium]|jgi:signal transduction histidine kinase
MQKELSILVWMTNPADVRVVSRLLQEASLAFRICEEFDALVAEAAKGGGALLLEEEFLTPQVIERLTGFLDRQPSWSELPVVLLVKKLKTRSTQVQSWTRLIRNLTLVERPVSSASLLSILQAALQTRQRQYEVRDLLAELKEANEQLEEKVGERTAELERSNQELEQFAYVVSHDLQSPLRTIAGFLQLLAHRYQGELDTEADEFISFAVDGAERMKQMINDILAFSRVGTRRDSLEPTDCRDVLLDVLADLQSEITDSCAKITHEGLPTVAADCNQLAQLFQNLIGNALKYRKPDEPPRIHIAAEVKETEWEFQVRDNGIGIDPQYAERIFQIFQRLHTRKESPGTGIGLAICKKIVERHGGRIWVESEPGKGSTFFFSLPRTLDSRDQAGAC